MTITPDVFMCVFFFQLLKSLFCFSVQIEKVRATSKPLVLRALVTIMTFEFQLGPSSIPTSTLDYKGGFHRGGSIRLVGLIY